MEHILYDTGTAIRVDTPEEVAAAKARAKTNGRKGWHVSVTTGTLRAGTVRVLGEVGGSTAVPFRVALGHYRRQTRARAGGSDVVGGKSIGA
jgi:hypothetical protein